MHLRQGLRGQGPFQPPRRGLDRAPCPDPGRCRDFDPLLRGLPLRPAHRAERMGQGPSTRASPAMKSSAGYRGSARASPGSRSATSPRSAAWSTPAAPVRAAGGLRAVLRERASILTYNSPTGAAAGRPTAAIPSSIVVDEAFVLKVPQSLDLRRRRAPALRGHHHLFAAAPLEGRPGPEGRHRRPRRPRPHGRSSSPAPSGAHVVLFTTSPAKAADALRLGAA